MTDRYLHHITITTGDSRRSYRHEVADDVIERLRPILRAAETRDAPLPALDPPCSLRVLEATSGCLLASVCLVEDELPLVTLGVARRSRCAVSLWRILTEIGDPVVAPRLARPPVPWLAVRLEPAAALYGPGHPLLPAVADLERCLAWTWIESVVDAH
jgi:hypothetical protein